MLRNMRLLLTIGVLACGLAVPASAAGVDPMKLVLQQVDVPQGYELNKDESLRTSNSFVSSQQESRTIVVRSGRLTGYLIQYTNYGPPGWRHVLSSVDVFRTPAGAKRFFDWRLKRHRSDFAGPTARGPESLGDAAWAYSARSLGPGSTVFWREGRVVAVVSCRVMAGHQRVALEMARKQQRRIAAALR
jgi:hypothetical protein